MSMRTLIFILLFRVIWVTGYSQTNVNEQELSNTYNEKGDYFFGKKNYDKAIVFYNMAYKEYSNSYSVFKKAEAYTRLNLLEQAEECYKTAFKSTQRVDNIFRLKYALVLLTNNKPTEARKWLSKYKEIIQEDIKGFISSENRDKLYKDSTIKFITNVKEINSKEAELNPVVFGDELIFSSTRKDLKGSSGNRHYNLFSTLLLDNGKPGRVSVYNKSMNSELNDGPLAFTTFDNQLFITRSTSPKSAMKTFQGNIPISVSEAVDLSKIEIEDFNYSIGHPVFNTNGTIMYFVSNAPGGMGGTDIYKSRLKDNKWTAPVNMGKDINTNGDEMYPFIFNDSILYFASNGLGGYGGMDIFKVNLIYANKVVNNLGNQVNTEFDDYGFFLTTDGQRGYFTSNRPGGAGREDIYLVEFINFKIRYAGYKPRKRIDENKLNIILSNSKEFNIDASKGTFDFGFQPEEGYKLIIQKENVRVEDVIQNQVLSSEQKQKKLLNPEPLQRAEIYIPPGMKHQFSIGKTAIRDEYLDDLRGLANEYQSPDENSINLTALAKDLELAEGEVYTIRFIKDDSKISRYKAKGETSLFVNDQTIEMHGESFLMVLPLKAETNFNIQTDIKSIKENFNSKKFAVVIDEKPVFEQEKGEWLISMTVNTEAPAEVKAQNRLVAEEISIIPGIEYILTLRKTDPQTALTNEIFVPLTRGVKYNLGSIQKTEGDYKKELDRFLSERENVEPKNEEVIDISLLSKELEILPGEEMVFDLLPTKHFGKKPDASTEMKTKLKLDGKEYTITRNEKYTINVPLNRKRKLNIQTDIGFIKENFKPNDFVVNLDTSLSFLSEISVDTTGYAALSASGYLVSMNVNTNTVTEVDVRNQYTATDVSIIPGKEYILTVIKIDRETREETEIIVPLTRDVKYDFTTNPKSEEEYRKSLDKFLAGQESITTIDGEVIDISLLSKELQIEQGDEISFSLLPVKDIFNKQSSSEEPTSSLYLDNQVVEFTYIQKYTINVPLSKERTMNIQTDVEHIQENFEPGSFTVKVDTISFFSEITVDTTGYGDRVIKDEEITDPVFDVVVINFASDKYALRPQDKDVIKKGVINALKGDKRLYVTIKGFTDALGDANYNLKLSKKRAESVQEYIRSNGIGEGRIRTFSFGESQALDKGVNWDDLSDEELQKHRKVEIVIYLPED